MVNIRPVLLGDGRSPARRDGLVVGLARSLPLPELGFNDPPVGRHLHSGDSPAVWKWEHVSGFQRNVEGVDEVLRQFDPAGEPGDLRTHVDAVER